MSGQKAEGFRGVADLGDQHRDTDVITKCRTDILKFVRENPGSSQTGVCKGVYGRTAEIVAMIYALEGEGAIENRGGPKYQRWHVPESWSPARLSPGDLDEEPPTIRYRRGRYYIAAISCTHYGGHYSCTQELEDYVNYVHEEYGITTIYHCGDFLQGLDKKWETAIKHNHFDGQIREAIELLPRRPWLSWVGITGNHDGKFGDRIGTEVGWMITTKWRESGRTDYRYIGHCQGVDYLVLPDAPRPIRIELGHYSGNARRLENTLRGFIEVQDEHTDFKLCGHPHRQCCIVASGKTSAAMVGTFSMAKYGRRYPTRVDVGGGIFGFALDRRGRPYDISYHFREYDTVKPWEWGARERWGDLALC